VRALTYLEKHLADGHALSRQVGRRLHDLPKARPELIAALSCSGDDLVANVEHGGSARSGASWHVLRNRMNEYLNGSRGVILFEHFLARAHDPWIRSNTRLLLVDGDDAYFAAEAASDVDEAYRLACSFHTTVFGLEGIGLDALRRGDGALDVSAAAEHTAAVFASAYDGEAFIGARLSVAKHEE
jgi:hypothetical protein